MIDWIYIQTLYDSGLSTRELTKATGISGGVLDAATKKGLLTRRSRQEAAIIHRKKKPTHHNFEARELRRQLIQARYEQGWQPKAGRCRKFKYTSPIAGDVLLDGTWELTVAKYFDSVKYHWKRNVIRFPYTNLKGSISYYTPDFYVEELGGYLEVKGYETDLDRCKWSQFTEKLTVWKKDNILKLRMGVRVADAESLLNS